MVFDWLAILKTPAGSILKKLLSFTGDWYARSKARKRAIRGEDLASQGSLNHIVKVELERLAASNRLPIELQSEEFRSWLRRGDLVELFVEVLIAEAGGFTDIAKGAKERLAIEYERTTQETRKLAPGRVGLAVSYVYGQLRATEAGRQALQLALEQWTAAQVFRFSYSEQDPFPNDHDLARVKAMAATLLEAGKRSWKMPPFIAPLILEEHTQQNDRIPSPTDAAALLSVIESGDSLVLFGAGGIGKTTFLLDLGTSCLNSERRIPIYLEVAVWARANATLVNYLSNLPSARANKVTSSELTKLFKAGRIVIMLNGWNEMPASSKLVCGDGLIHLKAATEALSFVVTSRTSSDVPSLPSAKRVEVRGLTWKGQSAIVLAELGDEGMMPLLELLSRNTRLRHAARSPLILQGLVAQARKGILSTSCTYDLLAAAVHAYEENEQRYLVLSDAPLDGYQSVYLEELACFLTQRLATNCSRDDSLQAIHCAASRLAERQQISALPNLSSVLNVLVSHHLLHLDDGVVRFVHQRFQEYFSAIRLLRECLKDRVLPEITHTKFNHPAWDESLALVGEKLKGEGIPATARVRMVKAAASIDVGLACDLAGICEFNEADDPELQLYLVTCVNEIASSPFKEVQDLGVAWQIASGLPAFSERLWQLLESEDQQTRLHTYRLNGSTLSIAQLGIGAEQRVASWPPDRRVEFVREIGDNPDNYDFLVGLARGEPDPVVRAAAISSLFWYFPASDVPLQAWLDAPIKVQTDYDVLSDVLYTVKRGSAGDRVRERLQNLAHNDSSDSTKLRLALAFPNEIGPHALKIIFERLRRSERHQNDAPLVAIARIHASKRLLDLVMELAMQDRHVPNWVSDYLQKAPVEVKTEVFERAWAAMQGQDFRNIRSEILGPLSASNQTERSVAAWLKYTEAERGTLTSVVRERQRQLEDIISHAPGGDLLNVVMRRGEAATYKEAAHLIDLVLKRIGHDGGNVRTSDQWMPTVEEVRQLIALFADKVETAEVPQNKIRVYLCSIASHVEPTEFGSFMLESCLQHLDAWSIFLEKIKQWSRKASSPRPSNPYLGLYLVSALARWGFDALPGLVELMTHPCAMEFIPQAISRIVSLPWSSKREGFFSNIDTDLQEGEQRRKLGRVLLQPDDTFQQWTDEAAKVLGQKLSEMVILYLEKKYSNDKWNALEAEHRVGELAGVVASIPSASVVDPVYHALTSGLMNIYGTVRALRGLIRQGLYISDQAVVDQVEALVERMVKEKWLDSSSRYAMSELSELLFCVEPISLLSKPIGYYLKQWQRFSHPKEIIRHLGAMRSEAGWLGLLELSKELSEKGRPPEELAEALSSALTSQRLTEFIAFVDDGRLFEWCRSGWILERLAPTVAAVLEEEAGQIDGFVEACRKTQSPLADTFAGKVLSCIKGCEETHQCFLLEALDAGRADHPNMPAYRMLRDLFTHNEPINNSQYEVTPKANNDLRIKLYARAKGSGPIADSCRCLLAFLECARRETSRPVDEPRHPAPEDGLAWTDVLLVRK